MLSVDQVSWQIRGMDILREVTFELDVGQHLAVLGPNGAGKSSLLRVLSADERPSAGRVRFLDQDLDRVSITARSSQIAVLSQQAFIRFPFRVWELVALGRFPFEDQTRTRQIVDEVLNSLELSDLKNRSILNLSGGEIQRVHLARALTQVWTTAEPSLLLLDEPLSSLDVSHQVLVRQLLKKMLRQSPLSIISVIHDLTQATEDFDLALLLGRQGHQKDFGTPINVLTRESLSALFSSRVDGVFDLEGLPKGFRVNAD